MPLRRILMVLAVSALLAAMIVASAMPAFAAPKAGAGCKGLLKAIEKQTEKRGTPNPVLVQKATDRGCIVSETPPVEETLPTA
jgi:hypothetical protein